MSIMADGRTYLIRIVTFILFAGQYYGVNGGCATGIDGSSPIIPCESTVEENCCGCPFKFYDPVDSRPKTPISVIRWGKCTDEECIVPLETDVCSKTLQELNKVAELPIPERENKKLCGLDIIVTVNVRSGVTKGVDSNLVYEKIRQFLVRFVEESRIGPDKSGTQIGLISYYKFLRTHFSMDASLDASTLLGQIKSVDFNTAFGKKAHPHKSFTEIRTGVNNFNNSILGHRPKNQNVVIVFDDGKPTHRTYNKMLQAANNLKKIAQVFVIGIGVQGKDKQKSKELRILKEMASVEDQVVTTSMWDYRNNIDDLVFKTIDKLPRYCEIVLHGGSS
ncbi:unnamed protein product [Owenia fusiformis]|uniref:VWFA domain-containing protein n=1 Tax=Owenia fusiformis TaxID=6347 RepID=A0A8S4NT51_OWEFU|nr:unnamed protein product [Owenia fusiformis]